MAINFKELGLVNTREMFKRAVSGGYAIPAFNFNNLEQLQAIITASAELRSPVILQVSKGARNYANPTLLRYMAEGAVAYAKELGCKHPEIALHLDHGDTFELVKDCVDMVAEESHYTKPEEVIDFSQRSGCDSLAISIGTSHGAYKFKPEQCTRDPKTGRLVPPPLAFDVLAEIEKKLPGFPIVLHGSSSVPQNYVDIINKYGGNLPDAVGIPEEELRQASKSAVCKINIDSDSRLAYTAGIRETLFEHPDYFDPRQYGKVARAYMTDMYKEKITDVLGSNNKLANCE